MNWEATLNVGAWVIVIVGSAFVGGMITAIIYDMKGK